MAPDSPQKLLPAGDIKTAGDPWFARGDLPSELRESVARRLGALGLLGAATFVVFAIFSWPNGWHTRNHFEFVMAAACEPAAITACLLVYAIARRHKDNLRLLLRVGAGYQILMAAIVGLIDNAVLTESPTDVRGWSNVAVWIFVFAVFVPNTPVRTLWLSLIVALMDPLTMAVAVVLGAPLPHWTLLPKMFGPTAVAVLTAVIAARINTRLGSKLHAARELGSYRLVEQLGAGGMGEVWRAEHKLLARPAAIKLIRPEALTMGDGKLAPTILHRFEREAKATALLESEHTVELYDFGLATDGSFYYVMELLAGLDLEQLVSRFGPMSPARAVHCLLQACESLAEAHQRGLVHRDIKPSNLFLCRRGLKYDFIKVLDFGLVRAVPGSVSGLSTSRIENVVCGTPGYMAPEAIAGDNEIDGRADLYALGCVAYWLLSGGRVFLEAANPMVIAASHLHDEPPRLSRRSQQAIPAALEAIVHECLAKDPAARPQSAHEISARLQALAIEPAWTADDARAWWEANHVAFVPTTPTSSQAATLARDISTESQASTVPARPRPA